MKEKEYSVIILFRELRASEEIDPFVKIYKKGDSIMINNGYHDYEFKIDEVLDIQIKELQKWFF